MPFVFKNFPISTEENFKELESKLKESSVKEAFVSKYLNCYLNALLQSFYSTPSQIHHAVLLEVTVFDTVILMSHYFIIAAVRFRFNAYPDDEYSKVGG